MTTPVQVDRVSVASDADAVAVAQQALRGELGALPTDHSPWEPLLRAYRTLAGSPWAPAFASEIVRHLASSDADARAGAAVFVEQLPQLATSTVLVAALSTLRGAAGHDPIARALGAHVLTGDAPAQAFAQAEALRPDGHPAPLVAALTKAMPDWVEANAKAIVALHPDAALPLLFNLQSLGRDVTALGVAVAKDAQRSAAFVDMFERFLDHPAAIRAAFD